MKILIVDDDAELLAALSEVMSLEGYVVLEASDGVTALKIAIEQQPDTILSDFEMPRMDGLSLHNRLREIPETHHILFILMTGSIRLSALREKESAFLDAMPVLKKPFEIEQLFGLLRIGAG